MGLSRPPVPLCHAVGRVLLVLQLLGTKRPFSGLL
ncbi:hypothetical protein CGCVW01_v013334 [Colletotrichum viniferum]|nr:hypothetical protein CGCVW01_v013334 [Colletotrichum viniferum]